MKSKISFTYCCADQYKKYYRKYIVSFKKQFGRKRFENIKMNCTETELLGKYKSVGNRNLTGCVCAKCWKQKFKGYINLNKMSIEVEI